MEQNKEIRFTEKKVDEAWKETVRQDAVLKDSAAREASSAKVPTDPAFVTFVKSLAMQALFHLGRIEDPATGQVSVNPEAAKEVIDFLALLKKKTKGNLSAEEETLLTQALTDLQVQYVEASK